MGLNGSIEGSNPSFSASAAPAAVLRPPAEGWQSGRMRRSRKPLSVVRRIVGSNPSPSALPAETDRGNRVLGVRGDPLLYAFSDPVEALAAAADGQDALAPGEVKVRMGLHTGALQLTGEGYAGRELHRAARIAASGHGGQVVVSAATRAFVDGELI